MMGINALAIDGTLARHNDDGLLSAPKTTDDGQLEASVRTKQLATTAAAVLLLLVTAPATAGHAAPASEWETAWATAPAAAVWGADHGYAGFTIRNVVHPTVGGDRVRIHLTNRYGTEPVFFGHVTVAVSTHAGGSRDGSVDPSDGQADGPVDDVLVEGQPQFTIPAGIDVVSDPITLAIPADHDLLVTTWTPQPSGTVTYHPAAMQNSVFTRGPDDHAGDSDAAAFNESTSVWHYLSGVDVTGPPGTIVAIGDSITDGVSSTPGTNRRWTDYLAGRLVDSGQPQYAVANSGISANRVLLDGDYPNYSIYSSAGQAAQTPLP